MLGKGTFGKVNNSTIYAFSKASYSFFLILLIFFLNTGDSLSGEEQQPFVRNQDPQERGENARS